MEDFVELNTRAFGNKLNAQDEGHGRQEEILIF